MTTRTIHLHLSGHGQEKRQAIPAVTSRVPRIARLMALAIRMQSLIRAGGIIDYCGRPTTLRRTLDYWL
jgi:hypothetical protein